MKFMVAKNKIKKYRKEEKKKKRQKPRVSLNKYL